VLGFPFIFRGTLDVRATTINDEMKIAASHSLAKLAKEDVPDNVLKAYGKKRIEFGREYIIPKPFDPRVLFWEATAVAKAAMDTGVAKKPIADFEKYRDELEARLGKSREVMRFYINKAKSEPKRIVFPEGEEDKILRAAQVLVDEGIAKPILLGAPDAVNQHIKDLGLDLKDVEIIRPRKSPRFEEYVSALYNLRKRKGMTSAAANQLLKNNYNVYGMMMVEMGDADGLISGLTEHYPETIRPALQIIGTRPGVRKICGAYMMVFKNRTVFISDATVNIEPDAEDLADIALLTAEKALYMNVAPRVAMLSFSNFGSTQHPLTEKVRKAVAIIRKKAPNLVVEGEMMADTALDPDIVSEVFPFSEIKGDANVLICPDLTSANIAYKVLAKLGGSTAIGPMLLGIRKPVYLLVPGCDVNDIVNITAVAVSEAQRIAENPPGTPDEVLRSYTK
jgi:malate dehydrogenase (oxaloacetate-decarboxylating)(NADP+)